MKLMIQQNEDCGYLDKGDIYYHELDDVDAIMRQLQNFKFIIVTDYSKKKLALNTNDIRKIIFNQDDIEIPKDFIIDNRWTYDDFLELLNQNLHAVVNFEEMENHFGKDRSESLISEYNLKEGVSWYVTVNYLRYYQIREFLNDDDVISLFKYIFNK